MSATTSVGINLSPVNYWSTEYAFIDRMKTAGTWTAQGSTAPISFDQNGYPTSMPTGASNIYTMVALDPASAGTNKTYVLSYTGNATFRIPGATIVNSQPGSITFTVTGTNPMQSVMITSIDSTNPPSAIHIVRQDQVSLFNQGEIFNPDFVSKISQFGTLRFMDWGQTNATTASSWSQRTTMNSYSWATTSSTTGVPIEAMVALANEAKTNMWINIPTQADDNYVRQMLTYVRDNLNPTLKVNVEYSNEVWNWSFQQSKYANQMSQQLWGTGILGGWEQYYGYRAAQVASIANDVFGTSGAGRLQNVLATQTANLGLEKYIFQGVARANVGTPSTLFGNYAVTTYFGSELSGQNAADRTTILGWANSGSAGLDAAFNELLNGGTLTGWGSLPSVMTQWAYQESVAKQNGLNLVAYEGGLDLSATNFAAADQPTVMAFFARLEADPRMADVYNKMISAFAAAGGTLLNAYTDAQADRPGGLYGTLKSIYDPASAAWNALVQGQAAAVAAAQTAPSTTPPTTTTPVTTPPATTTPPVTTTPSDSTGGQPATTPPPTIIRTSQSSYTLDATGRSLTYTGFGSFVGTGNALDNSIIGGNGGNTLYGGAGNDYLAGGSGNDVLVGGSGKDSLLGGGGADRFVFAPGDLGSVITNTDTILDFSHDQGDKIDLSQFDANTKTTLKDAFTFIGSKAFSHTAGELRVTSIGGYWNVMGDTNGDGVADFALNVKASNPLIKSDFILG